MASTPITNDDWIDLFPSSEEVYRPLNLQALSTSSGGTEAENQEHSSWGLWDLVQKPLSWVTTGNTNSVARKNDSVDSIVGASNMAASAPSDQKKPWLIKKAGGAVKSVKTMIQSKRGDSDEPWEHVEYGEEKLQVLCN